MKLSFKMCFSFLLILFFHTLLMGQGGFNSFGGDTESSEGSINYSAGLFDYKYIEGNEGSLTAGVQHTYDIIDIPDTTYIPDDLNLSLNVKVFPNPVSDLINVEIESNDISKDFHYNLCDINGRNIQSEKIEGNAVNIPMQQYLPGTYILQIFIDNEAYKSFKIIKNANNKNH
ncbi:MAG: T9SS type A sorting domain-containing protein [Bacteroidota bacterium]